MRRQAKAGDKVRFIKSFGTISSGAIRTVRLHATGVLFIPDASDESTTGYLALATANHWELVDEKPSKLPDWY